MVVRERPLDSSFTPVWIGVRDRLLSIGEKPPQDRKASAFTYTGVQILEPEFLEILSDEQESCLIRQGYQPAIERKMRIFGYRYSGYWNDLGTLDRLREVEKDPRFLGQ